jgi:hypothetical protein
LILLDVFWRKILWEDEAIKLLQKQFSEVSRKDRQVPAGDP